MSRNPFDDDESARMFLGFVQLLVFALALTLLAVVTYL